MTIWLQSCRTDMVSLLYQTTRCTQPIVTVLLTMPLILCLSRCQKRALEYLSWPAQHIPCTEGWSECLRFASFLPDSGHSFPRGAREFSLPAEISGQQKFIQSWIFYSHRWQKEILEGRNTLGSSRVSSRMHFMQVRVCFCIGICYSS